MVIDPLKMTELETDMTNKVVSDFQEAIARTAAIMPSFKEANVVAQAAPQQLFIEIYAMSFAAANIPDERIYLFMGELAHNMVKATHRKREWMESPEGQADMLDRMTKIAQVFPR